MNRALEAAPPPADPPSYLKDGILSRCALSNYRFRQGRVARVVSRRSDGTFQNLSLQPPQGSPSRSAERGGSGHSCLRRPRGLLRLPARGAPGGDHPAGTDPREAVGLEGYWGVAEIRPQPSGNQQVELKLNNFDEPKPNSYYEMWFVSGEKRISAGSFTSVGEGETRVLLNVAPKARNCHTLLITEEHVDERPTSGEEVALKGKVP